MKYVTKAMFGILCIFVLGLSGCAKNSTDARVNELLEKTKWASKSFPCSENSISDNMFWVGDEIIIVTKKSNETIAITYAFNVEKNASVEYYFYTKTKWEKVTQEMQTNLFLKALTEEEIEGLGYCRFGHELQFIHIE